MSSSNLQLIHDALKEYAEKTGIDLPSNPFAYKLEAYDSVEAVVGLLEGQMKEFKEYREGNTRLINWLLPVVEVVHNLSGVIGEVVSLAPFPPAKAIFVGIDVLLEAAKGVSHSYDALVDLFECIGHFLNRLQIYTGITLTPPMKDIIVRILVEVLSALALARKQIKVGRFKKFAKKLLGESEVEAVLIRLERLTQEEARMTGAQILEVVHGLMNNVKVAMGDGKVSIDGVRQALVVMQEIAEGINQIKRDQLQKEVRNWFSPPNPSDNYVIACNAHRKGTAAWFAEDSKFEKWMTKGSLMWIHGKPGSGKSVLCSTIIEQTRPLRNAGLGLMAYFYFDFKDTDKQNLHDALPSLLTQLSTSSDSYCDILSRVYKAHKNGAYKPSTRTMIACLKEMLALPDQSPVYVILDALDECPNISGIPPARKQVLNLLKDLVDLQLPNVHICVTSRPEIDIRAALEPLAFHPVSIHDQSGQRKDIEDYVRSIVYADSDAAMGRWRDQDKELVIETLTERADGMFRWVFCQLEVLQHCFPQSIRRTLNELPDSLDETYERVLKEIGMANRNHAHRLLQCLTVAVRPLRIEELAEILALDFEVTEGAIPKLNKDWRWEDRQRAVLSACSSLITLVDDGDSRVIQFSHFSVKEFLTSDRLSASKGDVSHLHIIPESAHTTFAQACMGTLLQLDGDSVNNQVEGSIPLARYAGRHWVEHAQFGEVSSRIEDGMRSLFDSEKPHFIAWLQLHNIDDGWGWFSNSATEYASPLYYASLCGFHDLVEHIIVEHPEQVNAGGGRNYTPLAAALHKRHFTVADLLHRHGAGVDVPGEGRTPLLIASGLGLVDVVRWLLDHGADADVESPSDFLWTSIMLSSVNGYLEVVQMLLEHGVHINAASKHGYTSLRQATYFGHVEMARLLLQHGADIGTRDEDYSTPLHVASSEGKLEIARLLLEHDAEVDAKNKDGRTPLHLASSEGYTEVMHLLLDHGANPDAEDTEGLTPLHLASSADQTETVRLLLDRGASADLRNENGETPL